MSRRQFTITTTRKKIRSLTISWLWELGGKKTDVYNLDDLPSKTIDRLALNGLKQKLSDVVSVSSRATAKAEREAINKAWIKLTKEN